MRIKGSLARGVLLAMGIALIPVTAEAAQNVTASTACKVLNQKVVSQDKTYTCVKSGKKLMWNKGVTVVKPTQVSTQTSTQAAATSSTQTATTSSTLTATPTQTAAPALETEVAGPTCSRNKNALKNC
jgi:diaminopimelate decarboxylase